MRNIRVIDANIILRFLTNDEPVMAKRCQDLLKKAEANLEAVFLPDIILSDIIWTLEKFYKKHKAEIKALILPIIGLRGIRCQSKDRIRKALTIYTDNNVDWTDALVASWMLSGKQKEFYSFDQDFDKIEGIKRVTP